jgi:hypothetical protein
MSDRPTLTHLQAQVLAYLVKFLQMNDQPPTCNNLASAFGWASSNSASLHIKALEKKGSLARNELGNLMLSDRPALAPRVCMWSLDDNDMGIWRSSCGELWSFIDGGPSENRVSYCHHCGGVAHVVKGQEGSGHADQA